MKTSNEIPLKDEKEQISNRGPQKERGSSYEVHSRIKEASDRLEERVREVEKELQRPLKRFEQEDTEKQTAFDYAKETDVWIYDLYSRGEPNDAGGNENTLAINKDELIIYKSNNLLNAENSVSKILEQVGAHNELFPSTSYELVGFTGIDHGKGKTPYVEPIFKQNYVPEAEQASQRDIDTYLVSIGFEKINDHTFNNSQYTVSDLHPRNVLKDKNGYIYVIDDIVKRNHTG